MKKYERSDERSYCLGMSLTIEALKHRPEAITEIILSGKANRNAQFSSLLELCEKEKIAFRCDDETIDRLSLKENCYCIAFFDKFDSDLQSDTHIVLYGFDDFGELGTVLRSAVSFDFSDIVLIDSDIDYFDPRCIRASMGSIFHCNIVTYEKLEDYLKGHPDQNIYPFVSVSDRMLSQVRFEEPYTLIISQETSKLDELFQNGIMIDHRGQDEISLSIRSSIVFAQAYHQKRSR
jgi:TrmH family RNA methyltransferase